MTVFSLRVAAAAFAFTIPLAAVAQAPTWSPDQMAVWRVVEQSWADEVAQNGKWPVAYADDNMVAWEADWPMPRNKASMTKWARFNDAQRKTLLYEISPVAIAISGSTAVVNYHAVQYSQRDKDKPDRDVLGITETLVKSGPRWKFLSTSGFNLKR